MLERFSATLEAGLLTQFDHFIRRHGYQTRSEAVRDLIRKTLVADEWQAGNRDVMGVITLVYDHHLPNLLNRITRIQHDSSTSVITATHVHMDHDNCLEIIIVRGKPGHLRALADRLTALRGVKNGSLTAATTGRHLT